MRRHTVASCAEQTGPLGLVALAPKVSVLDASFT
jgi:hypothetical protein